MSMLDSSEEIAFKLNRVLCPKLKFRTCVALLLSPFVTLIWFQSSLLFSVFEQTMLEQVGFKALMQAKEVAADPEVIVRLSTSNQEKTAKILSYIRLQAIQIMLLLRTKMKYPFSIRIPRRCRFYLYT